jgi:hypothetical protein
MFPFYWFDPENFISHEIVPKVRECINPPVETIMRKSMVEDPFPIKVLVSLPHKTWEFNLSPDANMVLECTILDPYPDWENTLHGSDDLDVQAVRMGFKNQRPYLFFTSHDVEMKVTDYLNKNNKNSTENK